MEITQVKIRMVHKGDKLLLDDPRVRAIAGIRLDDKFYINDIKVCQTDDRYCIEFTKNPYAKDPNNPGYTVVPITMEVRNWIEKIILTKYGKKAKRCMEHKKRMGACS
jgi:DNA-binding cell septation regulator SpoVG